MESQVYWNGDWWEALEITAPGESPSAAPSKWAKIEIPADFERFMVARTYAGLLPNIGQNDKAAGEERRAFTFLSETAFIHAQSGGSAADQRSEVVIR